MLLLSIIAEERTRFAGAIANEKRLVAEREAARSVARSMSEARDKIFEKHQGALSRQHVLGAENDALREQLAAAETSRTESEFRLEATQIVLTALLDSIGWRGLDRRRFRTLIAQASRSVPDTGSAAVQHDVLLAESRKVLDLEP